MLNLSNKENIVFVYDDFFYISYEKNNCRNHIFENFLIIDIVNLQILAYEYMNL